MREIKELFQQYIAYHPKGWKTLFTHLDHAYGLGRLLDTITINIPLSYNIKQAVLEALDVRERYEYLSEVLFNEIEIARVKTELTEQVKPG